MIRLQNCIVSCSKYVSMNTIIYQILKKKNINYKYDPLNLEDEEYDYD